MSPSSAYDRAATMFSPDGRLYQVEYASKIVGQGTLGVALTYKDGVILGADKKVSSKLLLPESVEKLFKIDNHIAAVSAGLVGDARRLVSMARQKAQENVMYYDEPIKIETLVKEISNIKQIFTQYGGMRPFGVSFIIGGCDDSGKRLFETEPSGALAEYKAIAIGNGKAKVMQFFEKEYKENLPYDDALKLAVAALSKGMDEKEKLDYKRLEFAVIETGKEFKHIPNDKLRALVEKKQATEK